MQRTQRRERIRCVVGNRQEPREQERAIAPRRKRRGQRAGNHESRERFRTVALKLSVLHIDRGRGQPNDLREIRVGREAGHRADAACERGLLRRQQREARADRDAEQGDAPAADVRPLGDGTHHRGRRRERS